MTLPRRLAVVLRFLRAAEYDADAISSIAKVLRRGSGPAWQNTRDDQSSRGRMLKLPSKLKVILAQEYPRFSDKEYARRHKALAVSMEKAGADALLVVTENRSGNATQWVTGWPGTAEALTVFRPGEKMWMSVEWVNHAPLAQYMCPHMDVEWGEHRGLEKAVAQLRRRGAKRVGVI